MGTVAIGANRGRVGTCGHRLTVHAFLVGGERSGTDTRGRHDELLPVAGAAGLRNVVARDLRIGIACRQDLVDTAMAILAFRHVGVSRRRGLGVDTVIVSSLLVSVAGGANRFGGRGLMRKGLDVGVTIGATEGAVNRRLELGVIDMQADLFAVLVFRETGIVMASQAVLIAHLGGVFRQRPGREQ